MTIAACFIVIGLFIYVFAAYKMPQYKPDDAKRSFEELKITFQNSRSLPHLHYHEKQGINIFISQHQGKITNRQLTSYTAELRAIIANKQAQLERQTNWLTSEKTA